MTTNCSKNHFWSTFKLFELDQKFSKLFKVDKNEFFCYNQTLLLAFPKRLPKFQCSLKSYFFSNSNISNDYAKKLFQNLTHFIFIFFGMNNSRVPKINMPLIDIIYNFFYITPFFVDFSLIFMQKLTCQRLIHFLNFAHS